ncbi:DUF2201 family putative metallopeptidase [Nannocystis radixulma]|uniref:DUF2201 family putative metallopeptidase n=1 Tax=Nannocystis radixulma TaxID=2995305 RepID=UPI00358DB69B
MAGRLRLLRRPTLARPPIRPPARRHVVRPRPARALRGAAVPALRPRRRAAAIARLRHRRAARARHAADRRAPARRRPGRPARRRGAQALAGSPGRRTRQRRRFCGRGGGRAPHLAERPRLAEPGRPRTRVVHLELSAARLARRGVRPDRGPTGLPAHADHRRGDRREARELYVNPAAHLDDHAARFVVAHELLHVGLRHQARRQGRDPYLWNVACDFVINGWLVEMGIGELPAFGLLYDPELKGLSAEAIYDRIVVDLRRYRKLATLRGFDLGDMLGDEAVWQRGEGMTLDAFFRRCLSQGLAYHQSEGRRPPARGAGRGDPRARAAADPVGRRARQVVR